MASRRSCPEALRQSPTPAVPPAAKGRADPTQEKQTLRHTDSALLTVSVPAGCSRAGQWRADAQHRRTAAIRVAEPEPGFSYTYEVTAEATVNGQPVTQTKTVQLRAGDEADLAFDMPTQEAGGDRLDAARAE